MNRTALFSFLVVLVLLFVFFTPVMKNPNGIMLTSEGDGIKTYTVMCGHIRNDTSWTEYKNMNYPYGQTHVFTDGQTVITNAVKFLAQSFPFFERNSVGIFNMLWLLSFPCCAFFLALILNRLSLPSWLVVIAASSITLLCPQVYRLEGHLTLSYACCFPLSWWLLIRYDAGEKRKLITAILILLNTFWFFVHPYYTAILLSFTLCIAFLSLAIGFSRRKINKSHYLGFALQLIVPLILTQLIVSSMDTHPHRPTLPSGFFEHFATFSTVFLPLKAPFYNFITRPLGISQDHWEGWAYIGLSGGLVLVFILFRSLKFLLQKNYRHILFPVNNKTLSIAVLSSLLLLAYSMAIPFRLGGEFLLDLIPPLRQFRSLGRFAWVFYFVFSVFGFYFLWLSARWLRLKKRYIASTLLLTLFILIQLTESVFQFKAIALDRTKSPNYFNASTLPQEYSELINQVNLIKQEYQCLVPIPFYLIGSDNFTTADAHESLKASMVISYWCNVPLLASSAARSPIAEARNVLQFFSPEFISKSIQQDLPDKKPFLLLKTLEDADEQENYWLSRSSKIWGNSVFILYRLEYDSVFKSRAEYFLNEFENKNIETLKQKTEWITSEPGYFYSNGFDSVELSMHRYGQGGIRGNKNYDTKLLENELLPLIPGTEYELSLWFYTAQEASTQIDLVLISEDTSNHSFQILFTSTPAKAKIIDGDWSLIRQRFTIHEKDLKYTLLFKRDPHSKQQFFADELLIRPSHMDVSFIENRSVEGSILSIIKNNLRIKRSADK